MRFGKCVWCLSQPHSAGSENMQFLKKNVLKKFGLQSECQQLSSLPPRRQGKQDQAMQGASSGPGRASAQGLGLCLEPERFTQTVLGAVCRSSGCKVLPGGIPALKSSAEQRDGQLLLTNQVAPVTKSGRGMEAETREAANKG